MSFVAFGQSYFKVQPQNDTICKGVDSTASFRLILSTDTITTWCWRAMKINPPQSPWGAIPSKFAPDSLLSQDTIIILTLHNKYFGC